MYAAEIDDPAASTPLAEALAARDGERAGNVAVNVVWKVVVVAVYAALYELTPPRIPPPEAWWAWPLLFFADDLACYWLRRASHESRVFWASPSSTTPRSTTTSRPRSGRRGADDLPAVLAAVALVGFPPWTILLAQSWSLIYQSGLHTYNPIAVAFHEYIALWRDLRAARSWRARAGLLFHGPGWRPGG